MLLPLALGACEGAGTPGANGGKDAGIEGTGAPPNAVEAAGGALAPGPIIGPRRVDSGVDAGRDAGRRLDDAGEEDGGAPRDAGTPVCGDGRVDRGEACDPGKDACCNATCSGPRKRGAACRPADGDCDLPEECDGTHVACPTDAVLVGSVCRAATGVCDVAESCDGTSKVCPTDLVALNSVPCGNTAAGDCDLDDHCDGYGKACPDVVESSSVVCRAAVDPDCDPPESCTGTSHDCPPDAFASPGLPCTDTDATDCNDAQCDGAGACDQTRAAELMTHVCRPVAGVCDVEETCDGGRVCPADIYLGSGICRPAVSECDLVESCDGSSPDCPPDGFESAGTGCGDLVTNNECDKPDKCDGSGNCDPGYVSVTTACGDREPLECSDPDECDGLGNCDPKHLQQGAPCGSRIDDGCTKPDACDGSGACDPKDGPDGVPCTLPQAPPASDTGQCSLGVCCPGLTTNDGTGCGFPTAEDDVVFVTSVPVSPDFGGVIAGDATCQMLAQYANLRGTFHAWLSDTNQDAKDRISGGPYRRVDDVLIASDKPDLLTLPNLAGIRTSELNTDVSAQVWTGTGDNGLRAPGENCADWTTAMMPTTAAIGGSYNYTSGWSLAGYFYCSTQNLRLYCFQDDCFYQADVDFMNDPYNCGACNNICATGYCAEGKCAGRVFVTSEAYTGDLGGVAGGDAKCNVRARAAGLPGTFSAWLGEGATPTDAKDRIADQPYYRVDGVKVADGLPDLIDGSLDASISVSELGAAPLGFQFAWTGTYYTGTSSTYHCQGWTSAAGSPTLGDYGVITTSGAGWAQVAGGAPCDVPLSLYCFQAVPITGP